MKSKEVLEMFVTLTGLVLLAVICTVALGILDLVVRAITHLLQSTMATAGLSLIAFYFMELSMVYTLRLAIEPIIQQATTLF